MITLRDYRQNDIDRLVLLANNKKVSQFLVYTFPYPYTRRDAEWWIREGCKANHAVTKVIEYRGEFVGSVGVHPQFGWKAHTGEIGYWIGEAYWGQGIATHALRKMSEYAFSHLKLEKLFAPVLAPNAASMAVLNKCGFETEGVLKHDVYKEGTYFDVHYYAKIVTSKQA